MNDESQQQQQSYFFNGMSKAQKLTMKMKTMHTNHINCVLVITIKIFKRSATDNKLSSDSE